MKLDQNIPEDWRIVLGEELKKPYFLKLEEFVAQERAEGTVFPEEAKVFSALQATPYEKVRLVILGQDPYHDVGQAHGLCFSVLPGVKTPPSLVNIYKELKNDLGVEVPQHGYLQHWAEQGILMLNAVLTVRAHQANSHKDKGWEQFTDEVIRKVGLRQFVDAFPHTLSGGMKMRVAIARALAMEPAVLLMDEPFAALDALTRRKMQEELLNLWEQTSFTMLFVTHSIEEAMLVGSRILVLSSHPGRVRAELNAHQFGFADIDAPGFSALRCRIHDMLFQRPIDVH